MRATTGVTLWMAHLLGAESTKMCFSHAIDQPKGQSHRDATGSKKTVAHTRHLLVQQLVPILRTRRTFGAIYIGSHKEETIPIPFVSLNYGSSSFGHKAVQSSCRPG